MKGVLYFSRSGSRIETGLVNRDLGIVSESSARAWCEWYGFHFQDWDGAREAHGPSGPRTKGVQPCPLCEAQKARPSKANEKVDKR